MKLLVTTVLVVEFVNLAVAAFSDKCGENQTWGFVSALACALLSVLLIGILIA